MREIKFRAWDKKGKRMSRLVSLREIIKSERNDLLFKVELNNLEWMQFTGLKDKNGKEIYEGDIVSYGKGYTPKEVIFHKGTFCYQTGEKEYHIFDESQGEVIGNIYEPPRNNKLNKTNKQIIWNIDMRRKI